MFSRAISKSQKPSLSSLILPLFFLLSYKNSSFLANMSISFNKIFNGYLQTPFAFQQHFLGKKTKINKQNKQKQILKSPI